MADFNADWAVSLPSQTGKTGDILQQSIALNERQQSREDALTESKRQFDERQRDRNDLNQFRYADFIGKNTDVELSGNEKADQIIQAQLGQLKSEAYEMAKNNVPISDLASYINSKVPTLATTSSRIKQEFKLGDEALKKIKELNPEINGEQFLQDFRKDIEQRAIDPTTGKLVPSHLIKESKFQNNILNPDYLANYLGSTKALLNDINNPKGKENVISVGSPEQYVEHKGVVPDWATTNFTQEDLQKGGGFMNKRGFTPQLSVKGTVLPMDKLPSDVTKNKPFNILDEQAYNNFVSSNPQYAAQVTKLARQEFPNYDEMNEVSKKYIKQHVLYNVMDESLKTNPFHVSGSKTPAKTTINNNAEKKKNDTQNFVEEFVKATEKGTSEDMVNVGRRLFAGNGSAKFENIKVNNTTKGMRIIYKENVDGLEEEKSVTLDPKDPNFQYELAGLYQRLTGSDNKLEKKATSQGLKGVGKKSTDSVKKYKGLDSKGNPIFE